MPQVLNNTDQWLYTIVKMLRLLTGATINGGGGSGSGNYSYVIDFIVGAGGGAPANLATTYVNPNVTGTIQLYKDGTGYMEEGVDWELLAGGGITLLDGNVFSTDEHYSIFKVV